MCKGGVAPDVSSREVCVRDRKWTESCVGERETVRAYMLEEKAAGAIRALARLYWHVSANTLPLACVRCGSSERKSERSDENECGAARVVV